MNSEMAWMWKEMVLSQGSRLLGREYASQGRWRRKTAPNLFLLPQPQYSGHMLMWIFFLNGEFHHSETGPSTKLNFSPNSS